MAQSDLSKINALYMEGAALQNALRNLTGGGRIVAMTISPPPSSGPPEDPRVADAIIGTIGWDYPQTMADAIRGQIQSRIAEINSELASMGVAGFS